MISLKQIGAWAFTLALAIIVITGIMAFLGKFELTATLGIVLAVLGLIIGLFNVTQKESVAVILASMLLFVGIGAGVFSLIPMFEGALETMFQVIGAILFPAGFVVAIKVIFDKLQN